MKIPWPLYLAWKQLFPSQRKFSFFSLLAVVGVALGVNVMIVVVAFMKGFQHKFREDIIDAQGHARAFPLRQPKQWQTIRQELIKNPQIDSASSYIQGPVLLQNRNDQSIPFAMGLDPAELPQVCLWTSFSSVVTPRWMQKMHWMLLLCPPRKSWQMM